MIAKAGINYFFAGCVDIYLPLGTSYYRPLYVLALNYREVHKESDRAKINFYIQNANQLE